MKSEIKKIDEENEKTIDRYDYLANAASVQENTGLIPANPYPEAMEVYEEVFHFEPPKIKAERK